MDRPSSERPVMSLKGISKSFVTKAAEIRILEQASLDIYKGETIAVVGASGIGKSTLLNIIGTLDQPDEGKILFEEKEVLSYSDSKLAGFRNAKLGFVFQFHYLLQGFTALDNIMMPGLIARKNKKIVEKNALNMLERVGLLTRSSHRVEDLSGGEQQRVALARALALQPEVLLADEPTGNLDRKNSREVHRLMKELNQELGMTIIVVTHNDDLAALMDNKVTLLEGKIVPV